MKYHVIDKDSGNKIASFKFDSDREFFWSTHSFESQQDMELRQDDDHTTNMKDNDLHEPTCNAVDGL
jgi:hypothetical protein